MARVVDKPNWPYAAALCALGIALGAIHWGHGPLLGWDDHGQYLLHARNLVEGLPYTNIGFIHNKYSTLVGPVAEPLGLPSVLALLFSVFGVSVTVARVFLWASLLVFGWIVYLTFRQVASRGIAFLVAAWTIVAFSQVHAFDPVLADIPYSATLWLTLSLADRGRVITKERLALLAVAGALAFSFRMAALPLLPAAATALVLRAKEERPSFFLLGVIWTVAAGCFMLILPTADALGGETLRDSAGVVRDTLVNVTAALHGVRDFLLIGTFPKPINYLVQGPLVAIIAVGLLASMREPRLRFTYITTAWYALMLLAIPSRDSRYLWPLYPLLAYAFVVGAARVVRIVSTKSANRTALGIGATLVALGVVRSVAAPPPPAYTQDAAVVEMRAALARLDQGTKSLRVVSFAPRVMRWEDGYVTMAGFPARESREGFETLRRERITHVVTGDPGTDAAGMDGIDAVVREYPKSFREVFRNRIFTIYATDFATE